MPTCFSAWKTAGFKRLLRAASTNAIVEEGGGGGGGFFLPRGGGPLGCPGHPDEG